MRWSTAESRLEPFRWGFALLVLALRELEALPGGWQLPVPGRLRQLACPLVEGPGRGLLAGGVLLGGVYVHGFHLRTGSNARGPVAGLGGAAARPGSLLWADLLGLPVHVAVSPTFEAVRATGEIVNAVCAVGAVPVFARLHSFALPLALATLSGSVGADLAVELAEQALDVLQGCLRSHNPQGYKAVRLSDTATPEPKRFRTCAKMA